MSSQSDRSLPASQENLLNSTQDIINQIDNFVGSQIIRDSQLVSTQELFRETQSQNSAQSDHSLVKPSPGGDTSSQQSLGVTTSYQQSQDGSISSPQAEVVKTFPQQSHDVDRLLSSQQNNSQNTGGTNDTAAVTSKSPNTSQDTSETTNSACQSSQSDENQTISSEICIPTRETLVENKEPESAIPEADQKVLCDQDCVTRIDHDSDSQSKVDVQNIGPQTLPVGETEKEPFTNVSLDSGNKEISLQSNDIPMETDESRTSQSKLSPSLPPTSGSLKRKLDDTLETSKDNETSSEKSESKKQFSDPVVETGAVGMDQAQDSGNDPSVDLQTDDSSRFDNVFDNAVLLTGTWAEYEKNPENFLKGCKWSPDGTCLVTNSDDSTLRIFDLPQKLYTGKCDASDLPEMKAVLRMREPELIYDYCWLPTMTSRDPQSCRLVSTSRDNPVHMWNAFTGQMCASYRSYDQADELIAAHSVAFSPDGSKLYCGFNKMVRIFDVDRPGRECQQHKTFVKQGQPGIISCISVNPSAPHVYAAGSYSRTIALYTHQKEMLCMFQGQQGGVTQIQFSHDGNRLYSGGRKDSEILCWDIRNPGEILFTVHRKVLTNQRIYFDVDQTGHWLVSGGHAGYVKVWEVDNPPVVEDMTQDVVLNPKLEFEAHLDTVNGVSLHPTMPILATSSGRRHMTFPGGCDSSDSECENVEVVENSLRLWWIGR